MANKPIPYLNFKASQLLGYSAEMNLAYCQIAHNASERLPIKGKPYYIALEGALIGCFIAIHTTQATDEKTTIYFANIPAILKTDNQEIAELLDNTPSYPFKISGNEPGSISHYNTQENEMLCFPLIGYQQIPNTKPTNLPLNLLPPAIRINQLLNLLNSKLNFHILTPISEPYLLPYLASEPIAWPWQNLSAISFSASLSLGLSYTSELGTITEAHTEVAKVYKTSLIENYAITTEVTLTLANEGTLRNTGLFFINITDPSGALLKHETITSYNLAPNQTQSYNLSLSGEGLKGDLLTITLVPDVSFHNLDFVIVGTITPTTNNGISINQLLGNTTLKKLVNLIESTSGKQFSWNPNLHILELQNPLKQRITLNNASVKNINHTEYSVKQKKRKSSIQQPKEFSAYLHISTINTVEIKLPSTKPILPSQSESTNYSQPAFLAKIPDNQQAIKVEQYTVIGFVPTIATLPYKEITFTETVIVELETSVHNLPTIIAATELKINHSVFTIQEIKIEKGTTQNIPITLIAHQ